MRRTKLTVLFLVCLGIVLGAFLTRAANEVAFLSFLNWGVVFGFSTPVTVDLQIIQITLAFRLHLTLAYLFCLLAVFLIAARLRSPDAP